MTYAEEKNPKTYLRGVIKEIPFAYESCQDSGRESSLQPFSSLSLLPQVRK